MGKASWVGSRLGCEFKDESMSLPEADQKTKEGVKVVNLGGSQAALVRKR